MNPPGPNFKKAKEEIERAIRKVEGDVKKFSVKDMFKNENEKVHDCIKEIKEMDELVIVRLKGSIDAYAIPRIENKYGSEIEKNFDKHILLDFKETSFVDSATLASLVMLFDELKVHHRKLGVINPTPLFMSYININKLESKIRIYKDEKTALRDFS